MADVDDSHAPRRQAVDHLEEAHRIRVGQAGSRLIHDEHFGLAGKRTRDLDHLLPRDGKTRHRHLRWNVTGT